MGDEDDCGRVVIDVALGVRRPSGHSALTGGVVWRTDEVAWIEEQFDDG